ncbi:hypothetical protein BD324DRAFT_638689 [Kockovaella imperatae]|uniref:Uncharacterized protein n=1 Tax=Kockovaella imperatae TaxID=4999 RepID=A0A1Y1U708_9TREE|nr:hypothetical protein BD324DRAFT_638689 [Kockovaella imperatae]ORX33811.1 hypothetical protein BD324DRAFT_638689 [Kockovaella imperatae]
MDKMNGAEDWEWDLISSSVKLGESSTSSRTATLANCLCRAEFQAILESDEAKDVLSDERLYRDLVTGYQASGPSHDDEANRPIAMQAEQTLARLIIAIALLHAFVQANWTGPDLDFSPLDLLPAPIAKDVSVEQLNESAIPLLTLGGEPAYHLSTHSSLFLLALRVLNSCQGLHTFSWWKLRFHLVHLSLLDEPVELSPSILDQVKALAENLPEDPDLQARYHLEVGLYHQALGQDKLANAHFLEAARSSGLEFQLTGALGVKTKFQVNPLSQLVLLAESRDRPGGDTEAAIATADPSLPEASASGTPSSMPETMALNDDTLLEETQFTKLVNPEPTAPTSSLSRLAHLDPANQPPLHPLDQSLLLSLCLSQHNQTPESGLTASQMMPFVSRVISHPRNWSVHTVALLLRSRLESTRSRTVERSALQLAALIEQMPTSDSTPKERLRYFHQIPLPSRWAMEKELAKRYLSLGVTRSALDIFTRLEMWEDAVSCLQRMERDEEAEKIVRDLLEGRIIESDLVPVLKKDMSDTRREKMSAGRQAKLWCILGDLSLTSDGASKDPQAAKDRAMECYDKAWQVSNETFSRAMRSKGALHFSSREYEQVVECLRKALEINPLYGRTWFTLGVSLTRLERWSEAKEAFQREVGVDEEDAEGWNNLAAIYLRLYEDSKGEEELAAAPFSDKLMAFRALRQGIKFAPNNWRMWSNYMIIAGDVGELAESARAMGRVIEHRKADSSRAVMGEVEFDVLDKLVDSVTRDDHALVKQGSLLSKSSNEGIGLLPILDRLFDHSILARVSDQPRVWRAHGRLARWKEEWKIAMEDYIRAYQSGPSCLPGVETDKDKFAAAVLELEELVGVFQALGPKIPKEEGKKAGDWTFQARGLVRTFIGRTRASFEDDPEMERLKALLGELKNSK